MKYKISIFTPCYNSEKTIHRVFDSLMSQTIAHKDFEWIVINDASTDRTDEILREYIKKADFDINYINLKKNQMLIKNYNLAIKKAKGELFVSIGHDDAFVPEALETFWKYWNENKNDKLFSISCLCKDQFGNYVGKRFPKANCLVTLLEASFKWNRNKLGETWGAQSTKLMKKYFILPDNIDKFIYLPESYFWNKLSFELKDYFTYPINKTLRVYYKEDRRSLSFNIRKKFAKGFEYEALYSINSFYLELLKVNPKLYFKYLVKYIIFSKYNRKNFFETYSKLNLFNKFFFIIFYFPSLFYKRIYFQ